MGKDNVYDSSRGHDGGEAYYYYYSMMDLSMTTVLADLTTVVVLRGGGGVGSIWRTKFLRRGYGVVSEGST